jgi:hypothetical protein
MRTSVGLLAAAALCLGAASGAHAQGIKWNPFAPSNGINFSPLAPPSNGINFSPLTGQISGTPPSGASQATFPAPGRLLGGPSRLINLLPNLHGMSNTHYIGSSIFPTQTDQYLAQFGYQRLR